jgi:DNA-binding response OmpR family regulator
LAAGLTKGKCILLVEDDPDIGNVVRLHLSDEGWQVQWATTGARARELLGRAGYDLMVLDLRLPDADGLELCREVRLNDGRYPPILMLTAKSSEMDRVVGLELGADDYLTKPFSASELIARVRALFRRAEAMRAKPAGETQGLLEAGGIVVDPAKRTVTVRGRSVDLTLREFELLHYLAAHPGRVFSRTQLLDAVWGYAYRGYEHTVNSHINRLRRKVENDPTHPEFVLTVWGVGYKFADRDEVPVATERNPTN